MNKWNFKKRYFTYELKHAIQTLNLLYQVRWVKRCEKARKKAIENGRYEVGINRKERKHRDIYCLYSVIQLFLWYFRNCIDLFPCVNG